MRCNENAISLSLDILLQVKKEDTLKCRNRVQVRIQIRFKLEKIVLAIINLNSPLSGLIYIKRVLALTCVQSL